MRTFQLTQPAFDRKLDLALRQLRDAMRRAPITLASYHRNLAVQAHRYTNEQLREAAASMTLADVQAVQSGLLREAEFESLIAGNLREDEATAMVRQLNEVLPTTPLAHERVPQRPVRVLPLGGTTQQWIAGNPDEANSALEMYLQASKHLLVRHARIPFYSMRAGFVLLHGVLAVFGSGRGASSTCYSGGPG